MYPKKAKVITICGSLRFQKELIETADRLELAGNCVLSVVYPSKAKELYTQSEIEMFQHMHYQRIEMSDAIYIVNVGGYIGESTCSELAYAISKGKEVLSLVPMMKGGQNNDSTKCRNHPDGYRTGC